MVNKEGNPFACVCGCDVDVAPPSDGNGVVDAGFAPPRAPPNRLPPKPPVLAGCDVPEAAPDVPPPRLPNKLGVVPDAVLVAVPNSDLPGVAPDAPPEAGCEAPRLPKSDMAMVLETRLRRVGCAENNHRVDELWDFEAWALAPHIPVRYAFNMQLNFTVTSQMQKFKHAPGREVTLCFKQFHCGSSLVYAFVVYHCLLQPANDGTDDRWQWRLRSCRDSDDLDSTANFGA